MMVRAQAAAYSISRLGTVIILAVIANALAASAQVPERSYRIGFLGQTSPSAHSPQIAALREGLRDAGYHEGINLKIEYRWAEGKLDRLPGLAAELARMKVDLIVTHGTPGSRAAKQATAAIPIVIAAVSDPVQIDVVASLARPGANVTGISIQETEVILKRLDLLRQAVPAVSRIVMLRARGLTPADLSTFPVLNAAARAQGLSLDRAEIQGSDDFTRAFSVIVQQGAQAIHVENTSVLRAHAAALARLAVKHRLPTVSAPSFVDAGVLIGYGPNLEDMYRRAADYVDRILKGAKPGDLPVEQPRKFELTVNLKTARSLALNIPREFLIQADRVVE